MISKWEIKLQSCALDFFSYATAKLNCLPILRNKLSNSTQLASDSAHAKCATQILQIATPRGANKAKKSKKQTSINKDPKIKLRWTRWTNSSLWVNFLKILKHAPSSTKQLCQTIIAALLLDDAIWTRFSGGVSVACKFQDRKWMIRKFGEHFNYFNWMASRTFRHLPVVLEACFEATHGALLAALCRKRPP